MPQDIERLIGAVRREVREIEYEGRPASVVVAGRSYDTSIEDLWDAVTNPERIPRWFTPVSGDLQLGGRYQLQGNAGGTITRCEPPRELAMTWEYGGAMSWVEVSLREEAAGRTQLEVRHIAHPDPHWDEYGPGAAGVGWELGLLGLELHVQDPDSRPPETDPAWMESAEAKRFMSASSAKWGEAAIAAGEDPAWARESSERTRKFYCGES